MTSLTDFQNRTFDDSCSCLLYFNFLCKNLESIYANVVFPVDETVNGVDHQNK